MVQKTTLVFTLQLQIFVPCPADLRDQSFDHVFANPPYFIGGQRTAADDAGKEIALAGETPLGAWVDIGTRRLKPGGYLTIIQKAERFRRCIVGVGCASGQRVCKAAGGALRAWC